MAQTRLPSLASGLNRAGPPPFVRAYAPQVRLQSSDNVHIQLDPLQSMSNYAGQLMAPGMQVAIYSGRCPLLELAAHQPPHATQQQACHPHTLICHTVV